MSVSQAPDETEFTDRAAYRKYLFLTHYTFKDREGEILRKLPGDIDGQPFDLTCLHRCEVALLDRSEAVQVDELSDCRVFIAACVDSVFVRNSTGCVFTVACKQLRTRDCKDCEFRLYCKTEPIIETSHGMTFAPFNGAYVGHAEHLQAAGLTTPNLWFGVYDFNDEAKTGNNWRLLNEEEQGDTPWRPLNDHSEVAVPKTLPGSVPLPSKKTGGGGHGGGGGAEGQRAAAALGGVVAEAGDGSSTMAFSFSTSAVEAEAAVNARASAGAAAGASNTTEGLTATAPAAVPSSSLLGFAAGDPIPPSSGGSRRKVGWDPSRLSTVAEVAGKGGSTDGVAVASDVGSGNATEPSALDKAKIGWDPSRVGIAGDPVASNVEGRTALETSGKNRCKVGWDVSRVGFSRNSDNEAGCHEALRDGKPTDVASAGSGGSKAKIGWDPSRLGTTTAGQPAAGGGGGGGAALSSRQQKVKLVGKGAAAAGGGDLTATLSAAGQPRVPLLSLSLAKHGDQEHSQEQPPIPIEQQRRGQQRQPEASPRICWDPTRMSDAMAVPAKDGVSSTTQPFQATVATARENAVIPTQRMADEVTGIQPVPTGSSSTTAAASTVETKESTASGKIGWNASCVGNPATPAPTMNEAAAGEANRDEAGIGWDASRIANPIIPGSDADVPKPVGAPAKPRIGWNLSRVENPTVPAPVMNKAAGPTSVAGAAEVATAVTSAVAVAGRTVAGREDSENRAAPVGEGGRARRREVPLQLRAVLLYASTQRGIDLRKWFNLGGGGGGSGDEDEDETQEGGEVVTAASTALTMFQFELVLAGLAEGLKAGLSDEERREIDAAVSPGIVAAAAAAATAAAPAAHVEEGAVAINTNDKGDMVDVGRLLDLCGLVPSPPQARAAVPRVGTRGADCHRDEVANRTTSGGDSADGRFVDSSTEEERDGDRGQTCDNQGGDAAGVGAGARDEGVWKRKERETEDAAVAMDENALRRVTHQADLYGRLLVSLGLKQPVERSSQGAYADWEASLRASTVSLREFRRGLEDVGVQLSRSRALALASRACGPMEAAVDAAVSYAGDMAANSDRREPREKRRPASATSRGGTGKVIPRRRSKSVGVKKSTNGSCAKSSGHLSHSNRGRNRGRRSLQSNSNDNDNTRTIGMGPQHHQQQRQQQLLQQQHQRQRRDKEIRRPHEAPELPAGGSSIRRSRSMSCVSRVPQPRPSPSPPVKRHESEVGLPAWDLRRYLVRLRCEPKSREERCDQQQRRRRRGKHLAGSEQPRPQRSSHWGKLRRHGGHGEGEVFDEGGVDVEDGYDDGDAAATRDVFAAWGRRIRVEKAEKERERRREFQSALAGRPHSLPLDQLLECVSRFEILPPEVLSRELQAMGKAFSESVEGARRARELVRRWNQDSPASRNVCGSDDAEQELWEHVQRLTPHQRRSRACEIVARLREEELAESEETSASVSRGLFLAYMKNMHGGGGGRDVGVVSLERWLEVRHAAAKKARELEAGRERAHALSKADTDGRKALVSEIKEELMRLVGSTKKTQKIDNAPGMEVLRSSRDGLDIHRRLKRLDAAAAKEDRARRALSSSEGGNDRKGGGGAKELARSCGHSGNQQPPGTPPSRPLLLSKRAFNAEMGDILFSLTADGAAAARAKELAGVPLIAADLRKKWAKEVAGGGEDGFDLSQERAAAAGKTGTKPSFLHDKDKAVGVPFAEELFGQEEAELLGRGKKDAEQKRELALQKYRDWSKEKSKEAKKARRLEQARQARDAERERRRRAEGLKAYRRWLRLASKERYFSAQSNKVVPRARLSPRERSASTPSSRKSAAHKTISCRGRSGDPVATGTLCSNASSRCNDHENGSIVGGQARRRRHQWNSSTEGAGNVYSRAAKEDLPDFL